MKATCTSILNNSCCTYNSVSKRIFSLKDSPKMNYF